MKATIICIGTELLIGLTQETNSYYISNRLKEFGVQVTSKYIVEDNLKYVKDALGLAIENGELIIVTGGLGPTLDDLTREAIAEFIEVPLELDISSRDKIVDMITSRHKTCTENNLRQAYFPRGSSILENSVGTAPGFMVDYKSRRLIALPGPPREMKRMLDDNILKLLQGFDRNVVVSKRFDFFCIGESALEDKLALLFNNQSNPIIATYASMGAVTLLVTATATSKVKAEGLLEPFVSEIYKTVGEYIYSDTGEVLEEVLLRLLLDNDLSLSLAESCTGGLLAARLTRLSGVSAVFDRSLITYSNEAKMTELNVPQDIIDTYGAVSEETAFAMLKGLKELTASNCCISVTGIAGPGGGTEKKPVGLVYIGICINESLEVYKYNFMGERERIQVMTVLTALDLLRRGIISRYGTGIKINENNI